MVLGIDTAPQDRATKRKRSCDRKGLNAPVALGKKTENGPGLAVDNQVSSCDWALETAQDRRCGSKRRLGVPDLPFRSLESTTVLGRDQSADRLTAGDRYQDARVTGLACLSDRSGGRDNRRPNQFVSIGFVGEEEEYVIGPIGQWLKGNVPAQ